MKLRFTDIAVSRLSELGTYYDETTPAFGLRVGKHRKTWFVIRGRERARTTIGLYPDVGLAAARKEAKGLLLQAPLKGDRLSIADAYEKFKADHIAKKKESTRVSYQRVMAKYFMPKLGAKKLPDVTYEMVTAITDKLSGTPSEQAHVLAVGRCFFRWCVRPPRRYISHSPLEGVQIELGKSRTRVLDDDELNTVWRAAQRQGYPHGTFVQLLILTGQRKNEIANLRRPWINEKERLIELPSTLTKNKKLHRFPYGDMTAAVLDSVPRLNTTDLLFPSRDDEQRPMSGFSKFKHELADGCAHWTLHDLRRTLRTNHARLGTSSEIGERLINHAAAVQTEVEAIYDLYTYLPEMRAAVTKYESHLSELFARA